MADVPKAWAATRVGCVRSTNEDRWRVGGITGDAADGNWSGVVPDARPWAMVADGMGGHGAGDVASSLALDTLCRLLTRDGAADLHSVIAETNLAVFAAMDQPPGRRAMGTTVAGVCRSGSGLALFNVGDSRIYVLRGEGLRRLSVDDTLPRRAPGRSHALTQSLGGTSMPLPLDPHVMSFDPEVGDKMLLCTDGLTDMLDEVEVRSLLRAAQANPAAALADAAVAAGGRDNVTALVLSF